MTNEAPAQGRGVKRPERRALGPKESGATRIASPDKAKHSYGVRKCVTQEDTAA